MRVMSYESRLAIDRYLQSHTHIAYTQFRLRRRHTPNIWWWNINNDIIERCDKYSTALDLFTDTQAGKHCCRSDCANGIPLSLPPPPSPPIQLLCIQLWLSLFNTHNYQTIIMIIGFTSLIVCLLAGARVLCSVRACVGMYDDLWFVCHTLKFICYHFVTLTRWVDGWIVCASATAFVLMVVVRDFFRVFMFCSYVVPLL